MSEDADRGGSTRRAPIPPGFREFEEVPDCAEPSTVDVRPGGGCGLPGSSDRGWVTNDMQA
jgi:hypothetical protein